MEFNQQRNNQKPASVNTRGIQFSNSNAQMPSTMQFGFWNDFVSIKMNPALDESRRTENKFFDYDVAVTTALTLEKAQTIHDKIISTILPAFENKEKSFVGVPVSGTSLFGVGTTVSEDGETVTAYVGIYKDLNEDTKRPETFITYELRSAYVVKNFSPETGEFEIEQGIASELALFASLLKASIDALSKASAHASRHVDKFWRDRVLAGVGGEAENTSNSWNKRSGGKSGGFFDREPAPKENTAEHKDAETKSLSNLSELERYM